MAVSHRKVVVLFNEAPAEFGSAKALRGGKGAGLAELTKLGLPVPPGFTITTTVARAYSEHATLPKRVVWQLDRGLKEVEKVTGKRFGDAGNPRTNSAPG